MPLSAVVIDERTSERGSEAQHVEWDAIIRELLSKAKTNVEEVATLQVSVTEQQITLDFRSDDGRDPDGINQIEALDMAKKVTHDRAGRLLKRELRDFGLDLETSRSLFTLLLSLRVDTTKLTGIHGHRTIR
jgi:hypothetical protein